MKATVGLVDNERLFLKSLGALINTFPSFEVVMDAVNGEDLLRKMESDQPDIVLIDVNMPVMDGVQTARLIAGRHPQVKMVALSMKDDDTTIISMIRAGCCAYLVKDILPEELERALEEIRTKGYYNADACNVNYRRLIIHSQEEAQTVLSDREKTFLQLASSDKTYKQIAAEMFLSERTIDGYRESVFEKFNVQSRVGMVLEGIRRHLVNI